MENEEVKEWLLSTGETREWLAQQCGVSLSTVNGWLSANRPIPGPAMRLIERLRTGPPELNPRLSVSELLAAQQKAKALGVSLDQWLADLIRKDVQPAKSKSIVGEGIKDDPTAEVKDQ